MGDPAETAAAKLYILYMHIDINMHGSMHFVL